MAKLLELYWNNPVEFTLIIILLLFTVYLLVFYWDRKRKRKKLLKEVTRTYKYFDDRGYFSPYDYGDKDK